MTGHVCPQEGGPEYASVSCGQEGQGGDTPGHPHRCLPPSPALLGGSPPAPSHLGFRIREKRHPLGLESAPWTALVDVQGFPPHHGTHPASRNKSGRLCVDVCPPFLLWAVRGPDPSLPGTCPLTCHSRWVTVWLWSPSYGRVPAGDAPAAPWHLLPCFPRGQRSPTLTHMSQARGAPLTSPQLS